MFRDRLWKRWTATGMPITLFVTVAEVVWQKVTMNEMTGPIVAPALVLRQSGQMSESKECDY